MRHADDDERSGESEEKRDVDDTDAARVDRSASISSLKANGRSVRNCATSNAAASLIEAESDDGESIRGSLKVRFLTLLTIWAILRRLRM